MGTNELMQHSKVSSALSSHATLISHVYFYVLEGRQSTSEFPPYFSRQSQKRGRGGACEQSEEERERGESRGVDCTRAKGPFTNDVS